MRFVRILIDCVTSPSGESEHQFWDNPCIWGALENLCCDASMLNPVLLLKYLTKHWSVIYTYLLFGFRHTHRYTRISILWSWIRVCDFTFSQKIVIYQRQIIVDFCFVFFLKVSELWCSRSYTRPRTGTWIWRFR